MKFLNIEKTFLTLNKHIYILLLYIFTPDFAPVAQPVEHVLGKDEATGSIPVGGFKMRENYLCERLFIFNAPHVNV